MVAVGLWASQLGRPALWLLPLVFPAMMALGAALGISGVAMPWVEIGILASVVVLGAAVALRVQAPLAVERRAGRGVRGAARLRAWRRAAGGEFGVAYGVGFVAATLVLHGIGIGVGLLAQRPLLMRAAGGAIAAAGLLLFVVH